MNLTIKLLKTIGSPFSSIALESVSNSNEATKLYTLALKNKIGLLYLDALKKHREFRDFKSEYEKGYTRYTETLVTAINISKLLDSAGIDHVIFKFFKLYPNTPSDVDVLFLCSDDEYIKATEMLIRKGYYKIGETPSQTVVYDLRGGYDRMDKRTKGGKKGGIYYIDLYREAAASCIIYIDKEKLSKYVAKIDLDGEKIWALKPEAELAVTLMHSVFPEQLYTLADYYTSIYYLFGASKREVNNFINLVKENKVTIAIKSILRITAVLHKLAHGFVPEKIQEILIELGSGTPKANGFIENNFEAPYRHSMLTVVRVLLEKVQERRFRKSVVMQMGAMLNRSFGKEVIDDIIQRRKRETY